MKIIYPTSTGIAVVTPTGELPIQEVARKDVPAGAPYLFVDDSAIPTALEADFSVPDGHGIGADAWFAEQATQNELNPPA